MSINLKAPELRELKPRIMVCGVGGAGGNAVNNMIVSGLSGVDFIVANTDAQALTSSRAERIIQMGLQVTEGLGAGSKPEVGKAAAEEALEEIRDHLAGAHMVFVTAGMGGGTGTGAAPVIARAARELGILTVGVVTKPFHFEGGRRMRVAENGIAELQKAVDTLIIIPNQNLFRVANEKTTFADAFSMADQVLYSGVACITDLMVKEGLINLDFADVRSIMSEMGKAMMGTGEAAGEKRAVQAAEAAIANPLLDETSMKGARGLLISITGGNDLTLYEVDEAASRIRQEVDEEANIILGATFDSALDGVVRVSVVATGIDQAAIAQIEPVASSPAERAPDRAPARLRAAAGSCSTARPSRPKRPAAAAGRLRRRLQPSGVRRAPSRSRSSPGARARRKMGGRIHSAGPGAARGSRRPHAADRGPAADGAEGAARDAGGASAVPASGNAAPLAVGKTGGVRDHPPRGRACSAGASPGAGDAASPAPCWRRKRPGGPRPRRNPVRRRRATTAESIRTARPAQRRSGDRGRPTRHSGVPAPAAELICPATKPSARGQPAAEPASAHG